jgi:hypothetical protein
MNDATFDDIVYKRIEKIKTVLAGKAKEYAKGDRLYNFKRAAKILNSTPESALLGMLMKHLVSVIDLVEGEDSPELDLVNEKIGDAINYLILLEAIFTEKKDPGLPF